MDTFAEWFAGERLALLRFATALTVDAGIAQDVVQEVAYRAHGRWDQIQRLDRPQAYLRRMVVNEYLSWRRKWSRDVPNSDLLGNQSHVTADVMGQVDDRHRLQAELAKLPPRQRAVVVLRFYEGLTDAEIAETLRCPRGTVRSLQSRALRRLRVEMSTDEDPVRAAAPTRRLVVTFDPNGEER